MIESRKKVSGNTLELKLPNFDDIKMDTQLLELCNMVFELERRIPDPREVALMDVDFIYSFFAYRHGLKYFEDYPKRPDNMR